ncbi:MAG: vWA domain-containing protein [Haliscomenobacter sp.]
MFNNLHFQDPWWLLLWVLPPLWFWWYRRREDRLRTPMRISSLEGVPLLSSWRARAKKQLPWLRLVALMVLIAAMARPQRALQEEQIKAEGIDIMLSMDLSSSMLAQDFRPDRLSVSKRVASEFVDRRTFDRLGLVVFSGEAYAQCPLTTDHSIVKMFLSELQCGVLEDGTAIGMGLATAVNRLKDSPVKSKVIILLTDGVNNSGYIKPITAAEIARQLNIKVYTVGVGSMGDALTPVSRRSDGQYIFGLARVEIDEALLKEISNMTGGKYFRATSEESLEKIYREIDQLEKTEIEVTTLKRYSEAFSRLVWIAFGLILVEFGLRQTWLRSISE